MKYYTKGSKCYKEKEEPHEDLAPIETNKQEEDGAEYDEEEVDEEVAEEAEEEAEEEDEGTDSQS